MSTCKRVKWHFCLPLEVHRMSVCRFQVQIDKNEFKLTKMSSSSKRLNYLHSLPFIISKRHKLTDVYRGLAKLELSCYGWRCHSVTQSRQESQSYRCMWVARHINVQRIALIMCLLKLIISTWTFGSNIHLLYHNIVDIQEFKYQVCYCGSERQ